MVKKAGVLGATGSVGQRFILLLANHPDLELSVIGASSRSAGKKYASVVDWKQTSKIPANARELVVQECKASAFKDCDVVFSGLDADYAGDIEKEFVDAGLVVISNAKNYRRQEDVPLVVPTCNPEHLNTFKHRKTKGFQVCISNCSTAGLVVPLKALQDKFGPIETVVLTTMQAVSGAGFSPGVPSMDVLDNLIPYISGEEDKLEWEPRKILAPAPAEGVTTFKNLPDSELVVSASCNRVPVTDGHTMCVSVKFAKKPESAEAVKKALAEFKSECQTLGCHSAPEKIIDVLEQPNRPQPRLDRNSGEGYAVSVGRVREDPVLDYRFVGLSHNTVLGAAGSGILIAELLIAKKFI